MDEICDYGIDCCRYNLTVDELVSGKGRECIFGKKEDKKEDKKRTKNSNKPRSEDLLYHYVYLITDTYTSKKYIGVRSCNCHPFDDSYMGSSKLIKELDQTLLRKDVLTICPNRSVALALETLLVNEDWVHREDTFNIKTGGERPIFSREYVSRQMVGIQRAKERGVYKGRQKTIDVEKVKELVSRGFGATEIAKRVGCGRASVYRVLKEEKVKTADEKYRNNWDRIFGNDKSKVNGKDNTEK